MSHEPLKTTEIQIGREDNKISHDNSGNMIFSDRFLQHVTLTDLLNIGGSGGGSASVVKEVDENDWIFDYYDNIYERNFWSYSLFYVTLGSGIENSDKSKIKACCYLKKSTVPYIVEYIELDDILIYTDKIVLKSSSKINCQVNIEYT
jgi:hypothetical protein